MTVKNEPSQQSHGVDDVVHDFDHDLTELRESSGIAIASFGLPLV